MNKIEIDKTKLHPWAQYKLMLLLKALDKAGLGIIVTCGFRSVAEQEDAYKKGYSKARGTTYSSQHQWGIAIDFAINYDVDGDKKITDDTWNVVGFAKVAKIAKKLGFGWGGDWKTFVDRPHLYLTSWGDTPQKLKDKYGTFEKFESTWKRKVKCNTFVRKTVIFTSKTLVKLKKGDKVEILWTKGPVAKVKASGKYGYIRKKNIA